MTTTQANKTITDADRQKAMAILVAYDAAIRSADEAKVAEYKEAYNAHIVALNGGTIFGMSAEYGAGTLISKWLKAEEGVDPIWGQYGEMLVIHNGMRLRVTCDAAPCGLAVLAVNVVDIDKPFISSTGYRSMSMSAGEVDMLGLTYREYVEALVAIEVGQKKRVCVSPDAFIRSRFTLPGWIDLVGDAGTPMVEEDGQLGFCF